MDPVLRLKLHLPTAEGATEIRRISVPIAATWADVLRKANELFQTDASAAAYYDTDGDRVVISSQEEWEECRAVCPGSPLQLHFQPPQGAPTVPYKLHARDGLKAMGEEQYDRALRSFQQAGPTPVNLYNIACCHSRLGAPAPALAKLREAVAAGYCDWRHMRSDVDLQSLHDKEEFCQLVQQLQAAEGAAMPFRCNRWGNRCRSGAGGGTGFWRPWKGRLLRRQAEACMQQGDYAAALTFWAAARATHDEADILRCQAGCRATLGDVPGAIADLRDAVAAGECSAGTLLADPLLAPLHQVPEFRQLVDGLLNAPPAADQAPPAAASAAAASSSTQEADCATVLAKDVLPQLAAAVEAYGPQLIAAVQMLSPELGAAARMLLDTVRRAAPRAPETPAPTTAAAPAVESGPAMTVDTECVLEEALGQISLADPPVPDPAAAIPANPIPRVPFSDADIDDLFASPEVAPAPEPQPAASGMEVDEAPPIAITAAVASPASPPVDDETEALLARLHQLGFVDDERSRQVLADSGNSLNITVNRLLA